MSDFDQPFPSRPPPRPLSQVALQESILSYCGDGVPPGDFIGSRSPLVVTRVPLATLDHWAASVEYQRTQKILSWIWLGGILFILIVNKVIHFG